MSTSYESLIPTFPLFQGFTTHRAERLIDHGTIFFYPRIRHGDLLDFSYFWGGRSSCKRAFLIEHGVFNPVFRFGCGDIELAFRLSKHGFRVVYDAKAVSTMVRALTIDDACHRVVCQGRSNHVFSGPHSDRAIEGRAEVTAPEEAWARLGPVFDTVVLAARHLDRLARLKMEFGFPLDESERTLLYEAYGTAFRAARLKGIHEARVTALGSVAHEQCDPEGRGAGPTGLLPGGR